MSYAKTVNQALHHKQYYTLEEVCARCPSVPQAEVTRIVSILERSGLAEIQRDGVRKIKGRKARSRQLPLL